MAEPQDLDLALVGNCVLGALIDRHGRYVWCCYPRFDGDPIFCSLIDPNDDDGFLDTEIENAAATTQSYVDNSAILATVITDRDGQSVRITDLVPRYKHFERIFRPRMLVRHIEPLSGTCRVRIRVRPRFDYGRTKPTRIVGSNHVRFVAEPLSLRLTTDGPISYLAEESWFVLDAPLTLMLGPDEQVSAPVPELTRSYISRTHDYWIEWARYLSVPFEWQEAVIRAAITLKLCSFEETGAIVAAMTTSIPEGPNTSRTWDYRYCWLRDAYFVVHALNRLGATLTMEDFIRFITNLAAASPDGGLRPVYGIVGALPPERQEPGFKGYRGMGPVRVGNLAETQRQNDSYGSVVLAAMQMFFDRRLPRPGTPALFRHLERLGEQAAALAFAPDAGLWEFRDGERIHTHSAVMCWVACERLAKIARGLDLPDRREYWQGEADRIRAVILERAWNEKLNSFVESFDGDTVDASLLLLHEVGFVAANDQRFLGTFAQIERRLLRGRHMMRYEEDAFGRPTTAFSVCTFWYIDTLAAVGRREEARAIFEELLSCRNHLGLLSEDIDPKTGELWGNFPQTYSMVGLIVSAMRLSKSWEDGFWRAL